MSLSTFEGLDQFSPCTAPRWTLRLLGWSLRLTPEIANSEADCNGQWDYDGAKSQIIWDLAAFERDDQYMSYGCSTVSE